MPLSFNGAWSAERGYDLRTPYNIGMGEIKELRVVPAFSIESYQRDTVTGAFVPFRSLAFPAGFPRLNPATTYHHACVQYTDPCNTGGAHVSFFTNQNQYPPYAQAILEKVYLKNSRIK